MPAWTMNNIDVSLKADDRKDLTDVNSLQYNVKFHTRELHAQLQGPCLIKERFKHYLKLMSSSICNSKSDSSD